MLKNLPYFVAAAEEGSFQSAASRLNIVPSAFSRRISDLESELGVRLFERLHQGVRLTPAGEQLLVDAVEILARIDQVRRSIKLFNQTERVTLRVGFNSGSMLQPAVVKSLQQFKEQFPRVDLALFPMLSEEQHAALLQGNIDAGFAYDYGDTAGLEMLELVSDELVLAINENNELAAEPVLTLEKTRPHPFIWSNRRHAPALADLIMSKFQASGVTPKIAMEIGSTESLLSLVSAGLGIGLVNRSQHERKPDNVVLRSVADFQLPLPLKLMWSRGNRAPVLLSFVNQVSSVFEQSRAN
jgi:DNA-binding transcriptional LysR family regulator